MNFGELCAALRDVLRNSNVKLVRGSDIVVFVVFAIAFEPKHVYTRHYRNRFHFVSTVETKDSVASERIVVHAK